jgi:hypothetical protein
MTDDILDKLPDEELTEEEHEALLLRSEHAIGPPLSFAAQAVLDAFNESWWYPEDITEFHIAVVLRAVADQICMKEPLGDTDADAGVFAAHQAISTALCTIAAELEALANAD